jgi:serine kinase of HPr protein (carbohydrate metabolism regulator)
VAGVIVHASCVVIGGRGVLLLGSPGAGKSDLVLRLVDAPGRATGHEIMEATLVSDDQTEIRKEGSRLIASPPPALAGLLEVRGLGVVTCRHASSCELALAIRLLSADAIDRMPDPRFGTYSVADGSLPLAAIDPSSPAAPARIRAALLALPAA